jgi:hemerythrin-like metal-binding protein
MPLLSWKTEYSFNDEDIDSHHQKLFGLFNSVYENVMNSWDVDCVLPVIDELSEYTRCSFIAEEQQMIRNQFHDIDTHIARHREFTHKIEELKSHYHDNNLEVTRELIIVLGKWLLRHVLIEDRKYSELSTGIGE